MDKRLAIIVPYRDRRKQLDIFIPHMNSFLEEKGIDYQIIVAEQRDDPQFADFIESEYLEEQVQALNEISKHISQLKRIGEDGHGVWNFAQEFES